jgi:glycosyl-4,4'-diaponeurosporenoate acyltransferase
MGYVMPIWLTVVVDVLAWGVFHAATGYAAHRLSDRRLDHDGPLLRRRGFESDGGFYRHRLRIHRWKDRLPEAGALFAGGISKRELPGRDVDGLRTFVRETRRAELGHWWAMACAPLFVLWNPAHAAVLLVAYGVLVNLPFIAIQRYNRFRVLPLVQRLERRRSLR